MAPTTSTIASIYPPPPPSHPSPRPPSTQQFSSQGPPSHYVQLFFTCILQLDQGAYGPPTHPQPQCYEKDPGHSVEMKGEIFHFRSWRWWTSSGQVIPMLVSFFQIPRTQLWGPQINCRIWSQKQQLTRKWKPDNGVGGLICLMNLGKNTQSIHYTLYNVYYTAAWRGFVNFFNEKKR